MSDEPDNPILAALARLEAGQAALQQSQATLQQSVAALATRAELTPLRAELTQVRAELTQVRVDLMARMDRLGNALSDIRDDIAVNFGAVDAVKRLNDNTREEVSALSSLLTDLVRKVRALETRVREIAGDP